MKSLFLFIAALITLTACSGIQTETVQVGENTFIHEKKVYRVIDNEITELGDLNSDSISVSSVAQAEMKDLGGYSLSFIRKGASTDLQTVYRGVMLYFKMTLNGLNDLREKYIGGGLTIRFLDEYGFQMHQIKVPMSELVRIVGDNDKTLMFEYDGETQMSSEVEKAIHSYSSSSYLMEKGDYGF